MKDQKDLLLAVQLFNQAEKLYFSLQSKRSDFVAMSERERQDVKYNLDDLFRLWDKSRIRFYRRGENLRGLLKDVPHIKNFDYQNGYPELSVTVLDVPKSEKLAETLTVALPLPVQDGQSDNQICYQCDKPVSYLFSDGRCKDCTRLTPEEVQGSPSDFLCGSCIKEAYPFRSTSRRVTTYLRAGIVSTVYVGSKLNRKSLVKFYKKPLPFLGFIRVEIETKRVGG